MSFLNFIPNALLQEISELEHMWMGSSTTNSSNRNKQYKVIRAATSLLGVYAVYSIATHVFSVIFYISAYIAIKELANSFYKTEATAVAKNAQKSQFRQRLVQFLSNIKI